MSVLKKYIIETEPIRFEGNNYSKEWEEEAEKRGLPNIKRTGYALDALVAEKNIQLLTSQNVFSKPEIESRYHTKLEQYVTAIEIEAATFCDLILTKVAPAAASYQSEMISIVSGLKELDVLADENYENEKEILISVTKSINALHQNVKNIKKLMNECEEIENLSEKAKFVSDNIIDALLQARQIADDLELVIPDSMWPLPKYSEMLFIM